MRETKSPFISALNEHPTPQYPQVVTTLCSGLAEFDHRFFHQRRGRTCLHAGAARNAFRRGEWAVLSRRNHRRKSAAVNRQRKRTLHFLARAHASRAHDAFRRIESEIWIRLILLGVKMIRAAAAIAHLAQTHRARHVLQLAVSIGGTGQAVQWMIGNIEFHHAASKSARARDSRCAPSSRLAPAWCTRQDSRADPRLRPGTAGTSRTARANPSRTASARGSQPRRRRESPRCLRARRRRVRRSPARQLAHHSKRGGEIAIALRSHCRCRLQ